MVQIILPLSGDAAEIVGIIPVDIRGVSRDGPDHPPAVRGRGGDGPDHPVDVRGLARLDEIVAVLPTLRVLRVDETPLSNFSEHSLAGKLESPVLSQLESLELWLTGLGDEGMQELARSQRLANLRRLKLRASVSPDLSVDGDALKLTDAGAACLAASPHLQRLESLDIGHNWLSGEGVKALLAGSWALRSLDLSYNWRLVSLGETFANATRAPTLRSLALAGATLRPEEAAQLARAPCLSQLEELNLDRCSLGGEGLQAFLHAMSLPSLRSLCLAHNSLRDEGALALAASPAVKQLTSLELGTNYIHPKGIAALASSPNLASLQRLLIDESSKAAPMVELLSKSVTLAKARIYVAGRLVKHEVSAAPAPDGPVAAPKKRSRKVAAKP